VVDVTMMRKISVTSILIIAFGRYTFQASDLLRTQLEARISIYNRVVRGKVCSIFAVRKT
jgi:hypothetical protein